MFVMESVSTEVFLSFLIPTCIKVDRIDKDENAHKALFGSSESRAWHIYLFSSSNTKGRDAYAAAVEAVTVVRKVMGELDFSQNFYTAIADLNFPFEEIDGEALRFFDSRAFINFREKVDAIYVDYFERPEDEIVH